VSTTWLWVCDCGAAGTGHTRAVAAKTAEEHLRSVAEDDPHMVWLGAADQRIELSVLTTEL
jgi:hypothetical protein